MELYPLELDHRLHFSRVDTATTACQRRHQPLNLDIPEGLFLFSLIRLHCDPTVYETRYAEYLPPPPN